MKKNIYITIFLILTLSVFIPSVSALTDPHVDSDFYFPTIDDYTGCSNGTEESCLMYVIENQWSYDYKWQCWYTTGSNNYGSGSQLYCFVTTQGWNPYLYWNNGNYTNIYNTDGFAISGYGWLNYSNKNSYYSSAILKWNPDTFTWSHICQAYGQNSCGYNLITANGDQFPTSIYSSNINYPATPYFKTDIWYTKAEWNSPFFQALNLKPRPFSQIELLLNEYVNNGKHYLQVTLYDPDNELNNGKIYYSYNNDYYVDITDSFNGSGSIYDLSLYTNGTVYFKITDSNDTEIYTDSYIVSDLFSISDYKTVTIPNGNIQVYLSNLGNDTSGNIYFPVDSCKFDSSFVYLDINGNYLGETNFNSMTFESIGVDTISGDNYDFITTSKYDFTSYNNTKVITFNHNNDCYFTFYVPNNFYVDYVDINDPEVYDCDSDSNINSSINFDTCKPKYKFSDNGNIYYGYDESNQGLPEEEDKSYFESLKKVIEYNLPILTGVGKDFSLFISSINTPIRMAFFAIFAIFFTYTIIKVIRH